VDLGRDGIAVTLIAESVQFDDVNHGCDAPNKTTGLRTGAGPD
jgi:hypothetical protein